MRFYITLIIILLTLPAFAQLPSELLSSANDGNATAQYIVGVAYHAGMNNVPQDDKKAVEWLTKSANQGFPEAQVMLATCFFKGQGVAKDDKKAIEWASKAAVQGQVEAQGIMGAAYFDGKGVTKNYRKAAEWYTKAAYQGHGKAQAWLGDMYINGQGVSKDTIKGCAWIFISEDKKLNDVCNSSLSPAQAIKVIDLTYELKRNIRLAK